MKKSFGNFVVYTAILMGAPAQAAPIWYNGDFDGRNALLNEVDNGTNPNHLDQVYDDFIVPAGGALAVNTIWSNDLMNFTGVTMAMWSIRRGVSSGNGGTVVASGVSAATQVPTGRAGFQLQEYTITVAGLNIVLAPGMYWLSVAPDFTSGGPDISYISTTSGGNAIGHPQGNDGNAFFSEIAVSFQPAGIPLFCSCSPDFSMGVAGDAAAPEPATLALLGLGLAGLGFSRRKQA